ncbi:MAG: lytic transglycosylase domain-containing protein [Oscillospiraceae bacterium]
MKLKNKKKARFILWFPFFIVIIIIGSVVLGLITQNFYKAAYPLKYTEYVEKYSKEYNLDIAFVYAVIKSESSFNPNAVSHADAFGLMQIQEETFEWGKSKINEKRSLSKDDLFNPEINIQYGCAIYRLLLNEFKDINTAIAAYHAGWGNVKNWLKDEKYSNDGITLKVVPIFETDSYITKINETQIIYNKLYF